MSKKEENKALAVKKTEKRLAVQSPDEQLKMLLKNPKNVKTLSGLNTEYVPIYQVEESLDRVFGVLGWSWKVSDVKVELTSAVVSGTLCLKIGDKWVEYMSGVGAAPLQFDDYYKRDARGQKIISGGKPVFSRALRYDPQALKNNALQIAVPSANSFALSNAAARLGKLFGRNLNGREPVSQEDETDVMAGMSSEAQAEKKADLERLFGAEGAKNE